MSRPGAAATSTAEQVYCSESHGFISPPKVGTRLPGPLPFDKRLLYDFGSAPRGGVLKNTLRWRVPAQEKRRCSASSRRQGGVQMGVYSGIELANADLVIDAVYEGVLRANGTYADPLNRLVHVSSRGGFRYRGTKNAPTLVVLTSSLAEPDWPDELDAATGRFVYYGDNREPGRELHSTGRFGNHLLRIIFDRLHLGQRHLCPPVLVFHIATRQACVHFPRFGSSWVRRRSSNPGSGGDLEVSSRSAFPELSRDLHHFDSP